MSIFSISCLVTLFLKQISEPTNMEDGCVLITLQPTRISGRKTGTKLVDLKEQPPKLVFAILKYYHIYDHSGKYM